jgi:predicted Zn-dependent protease with MMP-like domain
MAPTHPPRTPPTPTAWNGRAAPSLDELAQIADAAFSRLPQPFRQMAGDVLFHVQEFADEETLKSMGIEDPFELTGLYEGVDLTGRSLGDLPGGQSRVYLYRRPILDEWAERGDVALDELVEHVLIHELGHHMGLSDAEIEAIEASAR